MNISMDFSEWIGVVGRNGFGERVYGLTQRHLMDGEWCRVWDFEDRKVVDILDCEEIVCNASKSEVLDTLRVHIKLDK